MGGYSRAGHPVRAYQDGAQRGSDIDVFKDFPGVEHFVIDDAAASVAGRTVLAVVLNFGNKSLRHVLLTYGSSGELLQIWDTEPYYVQAIAADQSGHVFAVENRLDDKGDNRSGYALFCEYDPNGQIVAQGLQSTVFLSGSRAINPGSDPGNASLMLKDGRFFLYAPFDKEVIVFQKDGKIIKRARLQTLLQKITKGDKVNHLRLIDLVFVDEHRVALDLNEYQQDNQPGLANLIVADLDTNQYRTMVKGPERDWTLFGCSNGQLLTVTRDKVKAMFKKQSLDAP
jgi:hypothetical protein